MAEIEMMSQLPDSQKGPGFDQIEKMIQGIMNDIVKEGNISPELKEKYKEMSSNFLKKLGEITNDPQFPKLCRDISAEISLLIGKNKAKQLEGLQKYIVLLDSQNPTIPEVYGQL